MSRFEVQAFDEQGIMKNRTLRFISLTTCLLTGALAARAQNPCIEYGPYAGAWVCDTNPPVSHGWLEWTTFETCVGDHVPTPRFAQEPERLTGSMKRQWNYACPNNQFYNHVETAPLRYMMDPRFPNFSDALYFVDSQGNSSHSLPESFTTSGPRPYTAKFDVWPCPLVGWWPANGDTTDRIYGHNAELKNGASFTTGKVGQGFNLNGVGAWVNVPDAPCLNFGIDNDLTIECWIRASGNAASMPIVNKVGTVTGRLQGYRLDLQNGKLQFSLYGSAGLDIFLAATDLRDNSFHHVAVTVHGEWVGGVKLYVDGNQVSTIFGGSALHGDLSNTEELWLGKDRVPNNPPHFFSGIIDELSIYQCALSSDDISRIFNAGNAGKSKCSPEPDDHWPSPVGCGLLPVGCLCGPITITVGTVTVDVKTAPVISAQPADLTVAYGLPAEFDVVVKSCSSVTYQWRRNGGAMPPGHIAVHDDSGSGETMISYIIDRPQVADSGNYDVVISRNGLPAVTSAAARLTVKPATLTVIANDKKRRVGELDPTFDGTITGVLAGDTISATYFTTAIASSPEGEYPIIPSCQSTPPSVLGNYVESRINGTLTIVGDDTDGDGISDAWEMQHFMDLTHDGKSDTDYDGRTDLDEYLDGTDPNNANDVRQVLLGHWTLNSPNWLGEQAQIPVNPSPGTDQFTTSGWKGGGFSVGGTTLSTLKYHHVEANGSANINLRSGSIRFWFKPAWNSGTGPGSAGTLLFMGQTSPNRFSIDVNAAGTQLSITSKTASATTTFSRDIHWTANTWYQIVATYSPSGSALYTNGVMVGSAGPAVTVCPTEPPSSPLTIGGDSSPNSPAKGVFDELETFNYPLSAQAILASYTTSTASPQVNSCDLYPIGLQKTVLDGKSPNDPVTFTLDGTGSPGNFGWLDWNGGNSPEWELANNLTPPGTSRDPHFGYVNPDDANDHAISVGDWISGASGKKVGSAVENALALLKSQSFVLLPVYDDVTGSGSHSKYHVTSFAKLKLVNYDIRSNPKHLDFVYLAPADCAGQQGNQKPTIAFITPSTNYLQRAPALVIDPLLIAGDLDSPDLDGGQLIVDFSAYGQADDNLTIWNEGTGPGQIGVWGQNITYGGTVIGTFAGGAGTTRLVVTFNQQATPSMAQAVGRHLMYSSTSDNPSPLVRIVRAQLSDGDGGISEPTTMLINIIRVDPLTINLTAPHDGDVLYVPVQALPVTAVIGGGVGPFNVEFFEFNARFANVTASGPSASSTWPATGQATFPGTYRFTAKVTDSRDQTALSSPVNIRLLGFTVSAEPDQIVILPQLAIVSNLVNGGVSPYVMMWSEVAPTGSPTGPNLITSGSVYNSSRAFVLNTLTVGDPYLLVFGANEVGNAVNGPLQIANSGVGRQVRFTAQSTTLAFTSLSAGAPVTAQVYTRTGVHFSDYPGDPLRKRASFDAPGIYLLELTATDHAGQTASDTVTVTVKLNQPPVLAVGPDRTIPPGASTTLTGAATDDGLLAPLTYQWYKDDVQLSTATTTSYTYTAPSTPGSSTFTLSVYDGQYTVSSNIVVTVLNPGSRTYTRNVDFEGGNLVNLNYTAVADQLQLNTNITPFPFINIACSRDLVLKPGTVARVDVNNGQVLGEYRTAPSRKPSNPSRTTVDKYGNVWVGNRSEIGDSPSYDIAPDHEHDGTGKGSITRIGLVIGGTRGVKQMTGPGPLDYTFKADANGEYLQPPFLYNTCIDRDGDGLIKTSRRLGDVLPWPHKGRIVVNNSIATFQDANWTDDARCFISHLKYWFRKISEGDDNQLKVLVYSSQAAFTGANFNYALSHAYYSSEPSVVLEIKDPTASSFAFTLQHLTNYDAVFLAGDAADQNVLIQYVKHGGNVYLAGGTGGNASTEAAKWNTFLNAFGLNMASSYNSLNASFHPNDQHFLFKAHGPTRLPAVTSLYYKTGNSVSKTEGAGSMVEVADTQAGQGCIGVYQASDDVSTAEDEAIINYVRTSANLARALAIDKNNNVWVGGYNNGIYEEIDGASGLQLATFGGSELELAYGALIDKNGVLWSVLTGSALVRYDTVNHILLPSINSIKPYGMAIDPQTGNVWHSSQFEGLAHVYDPLGNNIGAYQHGASVGRGLAVDGRGNVWIAHSQSAEDNHTVGHIRTDGTFVGNIPLPCADEPTGVAVDSNGKIWITAHGTGKAYRIDPDGGPLGGGGYRVGYVDLIVDLGADSNPYNYSDMTGFISVGSTAPYGTWTVVHDCRVSGTTWSAIKWSSIEDTAHGSYIQVEARAGNRVTDLPNATFLQIQNGVSLATRGITGRFIEIRTTLYRGTDSTGAPLSPILQDLTVSPVFPIDFISDNHPTVAFDDDFQVIKNSQNTPLDVLRNDVAPVGSPLTISAFSSPHSGNVSISSDQKTLSYTPDHDFFGFDRFTYTATNALGAIGRALVTVQVSRVDPILYHPIAKDDSQNVIGSSIDGRSISTVINVLSNDVSFMPDPANPLIPIPDAMTNIVAVGSPSHGLAEIVFGFSGSACNPSVRYTPTPGYHGPDSFTYTIANTNGVTDTATVTVNVIAPGQLHCPDSSLLDALTTSCAFSESHSQSYQIAFSKTYTFYGAEGETVTVSMDSSGGSGFGNTYIYLYNPGTDPATQPDQSASGSVSSPARITYQLPASGVYTIEASAASPPTQSDPPLTGNYTVTLHCVPDGSAKLQVALGDLTLVNNSYLNLGTFLSGDDPVTYALDLKNVGSSSFTLGSIQLDTVSPSDVFQLVTPVPSGDLSPNNTVQLQLSFTPPDSAQACGGNLTIPYDNGAKTFHLHFSAATTATSAGSTSVSIDSPADNSSFLAPANFTLSALPLMGQEVTADQVEFFRLSDHGQSSIGSVRGAYTYQMSAKDVSLAAGKHKIVACANVVDDGGVHSILYSATNTLFVPNVVGGSVTMDSPVDSSHCPASSSITLSATARPAPTQNPIPVQSLQFFEVGSGTPIGGTVSISGDRCTATWSSVPEGIHHVFARATFFGDPGGTVIIESDPVTVFAGKYVLFGTPEKSQRFTENASVIFTAAAGSDGLAITGIDYYDVTSGSAEFIGSGSGASYSYPWTSVHSGLNKVLARATFTGGSTIYSTVRCFYFGDTMSLDAPANNSLTTSSFSARATTSTGHHITSVTFYEITDHLSPLGTVEQPQLKFALPFNAAEAGIYHFLAQATFNLKSDPNVAWTVSSQPVTVRVGQILVDAEPPVAVDDFATFAGNGSTPQAHDIPVLANDSNPKYPSEPNLTIVSYTHRTKFASITVTADGKLSYKSDPFAYGTDSVSYTIANSRGATAQATVHVTVAKGVPPTVDFVAPTPAEDGTVYTANVPLAVSASANAPATITKVEYFAGDQKIGESKVSPFNLTWAKVQRGDYQIIAMAFDSLGLFGYSPTREIHVKPDPAYSGNHPPVARISNPELRPKPYTFQGVPKVTPDPTAQYSLPAVTNGFLDLTGAACDSDNVPSPADISYQILLQKADGTVIANLTPAPLDADGYHHNSVGLPTDTGTPSDNGPLGKLDLSRFPNGIYNLRLSVWDGVDLAVANAPFILESRLKIGQFTFSQQDLSIPVNGLPLTIVRTYDSLNPNTADFGYSWTYSLQDLNIEFDEERAETAEFFPNDPFSHETFSMRIGGGRDVTLTLPDGRRTTFTYTMVPFNFGDYQCWNAVWKAEPGVTATLTTLNASTTQVINHERVTDLGDNTMMSLPTSVLDPYWQSDGMGTPVENHDFSGFLLTLQDGTQYRIEREDLGYHDVEDEPGHFISVQAYGAPRLTSITLPDGSKTIISDTRIEHIAAPVPFSGTTDVIPLQLTETRTDVQDTSGNTFSLRADGRRDVTLTLPGGGPVTFTYTLQSSQDGSYSEARWLPAPGVLANLTTLNPATVFDAGSIPTGDNILVTPSGQPPYWETDAPATPAEDHDFPGFILTLGDGTQYRIERQNLGLHQVADGQGGSFPVQAYGDASATTIIQGPPAVTPKATAAVVFQRDSFNRITNVYDPASLDADGQPNGPPTLKYEYDSDGNLRRYFALVDRATSKYDITTYLYDPDFPHFITGILDPRQVLQARTVYYDRSDPQTAGRIHTITGSDGRTTTFNYIFNGINNPPDPDAVFRQEIIDNEQNKTIADTDARGNVVLTTDALGHRITTTYDSNNNTTQVRRLIDGNPAHDIVMSYSRIYFSGSSQPKFEVTIQPSDASTGPIKSLEEYDTTGKLVRTVDARNYYGHPESTDEDTFLGDPVFYTRYLYDTDGRLTDTIAHWKQLAGNADVEKPLTKTVYITEGQLRGQVQEAYDAIGNKTVNEYHNGATSGGRLGDLKTVSLLQLNDDGRTFTLLYATDYTSDSRGNPLTASRRRTPSQPSAAEDSVTRYVYDPSGRVIETYDALGHGTTNVFNAIGKRQRAIDIYGNETRWTYNASGDAIETDYPDGTIARTATRYTLVRDHNNPLRQTISENRHFPDGPVFGTRATYDELGRVITTETIQGFTIDLQPDGTVLKSVFAAGQAFAVTSTTSTHYDAAGRVDYVTDALGNTQSYSYDAAGRRATMTTSATDSDGTVKQTTSVSIFDANGNQRAFHVEVKNIATSQTAVLPTTTYDYDDFNRRTITRYPDNTFDSTVYNDAGWRVLQTDQAGVTTGFGYNALGRLISVTNVFQAPNDSEGIQNQAITRYQYDAFGNVISQTDANNTVIADVANQKSTRFEYDKLGRRTKRTLPDGKFETLSYDPSGRHHTLRTDFNGRTTEIDYDAMGRILRKLPDRNLPVEAGASIQFTYTATGQRALMTDASGTTTYTYDNQDRLYRKTMDFGGGVTTTLTYSYHPNGTLQRIQSSNGADTTYDWDEINRLQEVNRGRTGQNTVYGYDGPGNLSTVIYPNQVASSYHYDTLNRLIDLAITKGTATLASFGYNPGSRPLSPTGMRRASVEVINTPDGTISREADYEYDHLYRLKSETLVLDTAPANTMPNVIHGPISYGYDLVGNRRSRNADGLSDVVTGLRSVNYLFDNNDRLKETRTGTIFGSGMLLKAEAYDANGNTTDGLVHGTGIQTSTSSPDKYDFEDRLIDRGGGQVKIVYDGDGHRVKKIRGNETFIYVVDDRNPTGYAQVLEELYSPNQTTAPIVNRSYTYGHELISQKVTGVTSANYYGHDGHGNVRILTDETGAVTDTYTYDAFGILLQQTGRSTPNNYLYCGEEYDHDLGLYYLRARYMMTDSGRFWSMDTLDGTSSDPVTLHKYLYASASPIMKCDPSGQETLGELLAVTGIIGVIHAIALPAFNHLGIKTDVKFVPDAGIIGLMGGTTFLNGITSLLDPGGGILGGLLSHFQTSIGLEVLFSIASAQFRAYYVLGSGVSSQGSGGYVYSGLVWNLQNAEAYRGVFAGGSVAGGGWGFSEFSGGQDTVDSLVGGRALEGPWGITWGRAIPSSFSLSFGLNDYRPMVGLSRNFDSMAASIALAIGWAAMNAVVVGQGESPPAVLVQIGATSLWPYFKWKNPRDLHYKQTHKSDGSPVDDPND
jgi:RHS repeat-associated protein